MSLDPKLERWIQTSLNTHFNAGKGGYTLFLEGNEINLGDLPAYVELRINGPRYKEVSRSNFLIELEVNLACSVKFGANAYELANMLGHFRNLCDQTIPVSKYQDTDPAEFVGCFILRNDEPNPIDIVNWGMVNVGAGPIRMMHATIDAYYKMEI